MEEQELNKKLAEWASFEVDFSLRHSSATIDPNGKHLYEMPNFTQSLDACLKWLVPKAIKEFGQDRTYLAVVDAFKHYFFKDEELALALCLAIERLIDGSI